MTQTNTFSVFVHPHRIASPEDTSLQRNAQRIADVFGRGAMLAELVGPEGARARPLVSRMLAPAAYVVVDEDRARLDEYAGSIAAANPQLDVLPVAAPIKADLTLPRCARPIGRTIVYFSAARLAQRDPNTLRPLLLRFASLVHRGGGLLLGLDGDGRRMMADANRDELGRAIFERQRAWGGAHADFELVLFTPVVE